MTTQNQKRFLLTFFFVALPVIGLLYLRHLGSFDQFDEATFAAREWTPEKMSVSMLISRNPPALVEAGRAQFGEYSIILGAIGERSGLSHDYLRSIALINNSRYAGLIASKIGLYRRTDCVDILEQIAGDPVCNSATWVVAEESLRELEVVRSSDIEFCIWQEYAMEPGHHDPLPQWLKEQKAGQPEATVTQ